jgi:hypothetical protein
VADSGATPRTLPPPPPRSSHDPPVPLAVPALPVARPPRLRDKGSSDTGDTGDTGDTTAAADTSTLGSPSFEDGGDLPTELKCERDGGSGESLFLTWSGAPAGTTTYALTLYALSGDPGLGSEDDLSVTHDVLTAAIDGLVLDAAELTVVN